MCRARQDKSLSPCPRTTRRRLPILSTAWSRFAGLGDVLRLEAADALTLRIEGALAASRGLDENIENNLVMRAARGLAEAGGYAAGAAITLVKYLPVAAGLGGGSSDAASALHGLNALWKLGAATDDLREIALSLGADVPVCLHGAPAFVGGIGEEIAPARQPAACLVGAGQPRRQAVDRRCLPSMRWEISGGQVRRCPR